MRLLYDFIVLIFYIPKFLCSLSNKTQHLNIVRSKTNDYVTGGYSGFTDFRTSIETFIGINDLKNQANFQKESYNIKTLFFSNIDVESTNKETFIESNYSTLSINQNFEGRYPGDVTDNEEGDGNGQGSDNEDEIINNNNVYGLFSSDREKNNTQEEDRVVLDLNKNNLQPVNESVIFNDKFLGNAGQVINSENDNKDTHSLFVLKHILLPNEGAEGNLKFKIDLDEKFLKKNSLVFEEYYKVHGKHKMENETFEILKSHMGDVNLMDEDLEILRNHSRVNLRKNPLDISLKIKVIYSVNEHDGNLHKRDCTFDENIPGCFEKEGPSYLKKRIPDLNDKNTLESLAYIASNAYLSIPGHKIWRKTSYYDDLQTGNVWYDLVDYKHVAECEDDSCNWNGDGLRGHVFVNEKEKILIIGIKGTTMRVIKKNKISQNDKFNDNLLFSCCCGQDLVFYSGSCKCKMDSKVCDDSCVKEAILSDNSYYKQSLGLYKDVIKLYDPDIYSYWVTGHSLGGAIASLLGHTFDLPTVSFESPGERLAAKRLGLPINPTDNHYNLHVWHFGNNVDPIFAGECNTVISRIAGYSLETKCHTGKKCVYDVQQYKKSLLFNLGFHLIHFVIDNIISVKDTPPCVEASDDCVECEHWKFV